jgi:signal recognition particle GTPase
MFETLTDRLNDTFARLGRKGRLTEQDVEDAMREVRRALLEADVNFKVAKDFVAAVTTSTYVPPKSHGTAERGITSSVAE